MNPIPTVPDAPPAAVRPGPPRGPREVFWRYLLVILIAKVLLEVFFFVGVVRQYGEEDIFVSLALPAKEPGQGYWDYIAHFRSVPDFRTWTGDPVDMYPFRIAALYPNLLIMDALGDSEGSLVLWSAFTGIATVLLIGLIGRSLVDAPTGLISASVLALIPAHIIYSARVDTDMPQLFFLALVILFLVLALKAATTRGQLALAAISGLFLGFLYLAKLLPAFLVLPWALLVPLLLAAMRDPETLRSPRGKWRQAVAVSAVLFSGFALVFAVEDWAYYLLSGHWFLHWQVMKGNAVNLDSWRCGKYVSLGFVRLWEPAEGWSNLWAHTKMFGESLYSFDRDSSIYSLPIHGWSGVLCLPALVVLPFLSIGRRRLTLLVVLGFVFYYLYQEFFWVYPTFESGKLNLSFVHKVHRFIFPCYLGISLCVGIVLGSLLRWGRERSGRWFGPVLRWAPAVIVLTFGLANYSSTRYFRTFLRRSLADIRLACADLKSIAPDGAKIYIAAGAEPYFRLYQYPRHYQWKYFADEPRAGTCQGWGVVGGFLGYGLSPETFIENYPEWLRPFYRGESGPPPDWRLLRARPSLMPDRSPTVRILAMTRPDSEADLP
jgi:hypothetical protein